MSLLICLPFWNASQAFCDPEWVAPGPRLDTRGPKAPDPRGPKATKQRGVSEEVVGSVAAAATYIIYTLKRAPINL